MRLAVTSKTIAQIILPLPRPFASVPFPFCRDQSALKQKNVHIVKKLDKIYGGLFALLRCRSGTPAGTAKKIADEYQQDSCKDGDKDNPFTERDMWPFLF